MASGIGYADLNAYLSSGYTVVLGMLYSWVDDLAIASEEEMFSLRWRRMAGDVCGGMDQYACGIIEVSESSERTD